MHNHYFDILNRISETPRWFDENGVPRYCAFVPEAISNIYANKVVLFEIECQNCGFTFNVVLSEEKHSDFSLKSKIKNHDLTYGDPPNVKCCETGARMTSLFKRVLEFWEIKNNKWVRNSKFENID